MKLKCAIVTPKVKDLAKKIGKSNVFTVNLISLYQSQTGKVNPEAEDLTKFLTSKGKDFQNEEFILPTHKTRKVTQKTSFVDTINGELTINIPSQEIKEELFNERKEDFKDDVLSYEKENNVAGSDLSKLIYLNITNIHDAYMFDLYLEDISNRNKDKSPQEQSEAAIEILLEIKKSKGQPVIENTQQVREAYANRIARENVASVLINDKTTPKNIESLSDEQLNDIINKAGKATIVRNRLSQNETPYVVIGNHIFSQKTGEEKYKEENDGVRKYLLAKRDAIEGKAIPVTITTKEGETRNYAVYDDNKIFSFTSKKFMADNWADTDITKKAIMEAVERERGKKKEKQKQDSVLAQILDHMANNLKLKLHFKSEAEAFLKKSGGKGAMAAINQKPKTLEEILSPHTIQAINTGKWDNESIEEFNNLITDIQNEKIIYRRIHEESRPYSRGISEAHAGASSILGGSERASKNEQRNTQTKRTPKEQLEEDARKGKEQERIIEAWAKAEDLWLNDYTDEEGNKAATLESLLNSQWDYINQGSEAEVYLYDNKTVLKSISLLHSNDNVAKALDKIALFNHLFPRTAMQVVGFGRDSLGHFRIIVTQPYVKGKELTDEELDNFIKQLDVSSQEGFFLSSDKKIRITDLGNYNILKDKDGNYFVIDADVEYLTPENGGNAVFENTFEPNINTGDNDVYMFIGKKAREKYAEIIKRTRPDLDEKGIKATLDFLHSLEDTKENTAYIKAAIQWITNGSITLPEDNQVAKDIFDEVRKRHVDISKYKKLSDLLQSKEMQPKESEKYPFDINKEKAFSNHQTRTTKGGRVFEVYDVENTTEGIRAVCHAIAGSYTASPWCLSTFTSKGEPTGSAKKFWKKYDKIPRKIAFENGKPVAFSSDDRADFPEAWWDLNDKDTQPELNDNINNSYKGFEDNSETKIKARIRRENIIREEKHIATNIAVMNKAKPLEKQLLEILRDKETLIKFLNAISRDDYAYSSNTQNPVGLYIFVRDYMFEPDSEMPMSIYSNKELIDLANAYKNFSSEDFKVFEEKKYNQTLNDTYFFTTPQGEIYGFVTKNGEIYLDETKISPEHPIHEYTHLWDMVVQKKNPELWAKGISLLQQFNKGELWNSIAEDENYGKKWEEAGITGEKLTNLIASEVHARLVGKGGEELLNKAAKEKGQEGLIAKIKSWILDIWKSLKSTFGISGEDIDKLTLKDFNHMTVRDFFLDEIKIQEALDEMTIVVEGVAKIKSSSFSFANEPLHPAFQGKKIASFKVTSGSVKTPLSNPVQDSTPPTDSSEDIRENSAENPYIQVNRDFTAEERHNRVAMISRKFSEAVDDIMNEAAEALEEQIANVDDPVDKASLQEDLDKINKSFDDDSLEGRHVALRLQGFGVDTVLKRLRENLIQNSQDNSVDTNRRIAYAKCVDNFLMLLREAATDIEWREGLKITFFPSKSGKSIDVANADEKITDDDAKLIDSEFKDDEFGERVPGNAGWSYNTREVNPKDTLGGTVKRIIDNIPVYDSNGLPAVDDIGYSKYLDHNYVHAILLEEMSELKSPEEFAVKNADGSFDFVALKKMTTKYPWAWNIISELQSNPEEIAAFYSDLRMDFISYWGAFKNPKNDVWQNKRLNNTNAKEAIVTQVVTMFEQGGEKGLNTIFIGNGKINIELAKKVNKEFDDFMDKQEIVNGEKKEKTLAEIINSLPNEDKVVFANIIQKQFEAIGFNVAIKQIFNWLQDYESYQKVLPAVAASGGILGEIEQAKYENSKTLQLRDKRKTHGYVKGLMMDIPDGNAFFNYFSNYYYKIAETIGVMGEDTKTGSFMQDGKQYYSYSTPNYMDTQMKYFLDDEKRSSYIQEHFKKYAWFYHKRYNGEEFQYNDDEIKELTTTPAVTDPTTLQIDPEIQKTDLSFLPSEYYYDYINGKLSFTEDELKDVSFDENTHHWEFVGDKKVYNSNFETKVRNINKFIDLLREYNNFRNDWLFQIENNPEIREKLEFKEVKTIKNKEADKKLRHTTYENWMPWQVSFAMIQEFWSETEGKFEDTEKDSFAWYSFPIFSDSKVAKYVRFRKFVDDKTDTVEGKITKRLIKVAFQELYRINHVRRRKAARDRGENVRVIANYDKNGSKFCFFTEFNDYRVCLDDDGDYSANDEGDFVIFDNYSEKAPEDVKSVSLIEALFDKNINDTDRYNLLYESISKFLSDSFEKFRGGIEGKTLKELENYSKSIKCIKGKPEEVVEKLIHDYFYNQVFATTQIIQISAVDLAFYKNSDDFEKRFKQLYAAGAKLFTSSRYGAESYKAVTLIDNEATSLSYSDIASSLDEDVKAKRISISDAEDIKQSLLHINMADGQAYRSLDGYREVMDMMGRWTDELEETYEHIKSGSWTSIDFNRIFQTIKPFVYTQLDKPDGLGKSMLVPYQVKDSESVLLAAYMAVALGSEKSQNSTQYVSPKMRGIARFMEKHGVRVVQFQSAVKVGDMGDININISHSKLRQWAAEIRKELDKALANKSISQEDYNEAVSHVDENAAINDLAEYFKDTLDKRLASKEIDEKQYRQVMKDMQPTEDEVVEILENSAYPNGQEDGQVVDTIPYSGYMIAQPTPEDLVDKKVVVGTQFETLITSDLPEDFKINFGGKELYRQEVLDLYNKIKVENIIDGFSKLKDIFGDIEKLQKELVRMVLSSPGYGRNLIEALELVDVDNGDGTTHKEFNIPTDNPTTANSLLRLIHAMFRNKVQRQEIKGGACILVSSYGYTDQLHTVYNKDGSIRYFECYLPASSKKLYNDFIEYDENGNPYVDPAKIPDELRRGIGYRIPTEDKYSMVHFYIKGFLPPFSGSKVMLPMEAVFFSGEDFDVDKKYLMLPTFKVERYDISRARRDFVKADASMKNISSLFTGTILEQMFSEEESSDIEGNTKKEDAKKAWREWWKAHKDEYLLEKPIVEKVRYDINKPMYKQSREARDNMMIDLAYKILQHRDTASKIQNPGNYTKIKREALMYRILNDSTLTRKWIESQGLKEDNLKDIEKSLIDASVGTLKKFIDSHARQRSSLVPDSFVYYHDQNMTGKKLVGSFAIVSSMHAKYEEVPLSIKKDFRFTIDGITYDDLDKIISEQGERISKNCASCLAAAPDTAKDPVLADVNFTTDTASTVGLMLRAGLTIQQAALFLKQPIVDTWVKSGESLNTLCEMLTEAIAKSGWDISAIKKAGTTSQTLLENILKHTLRKPEDSTEYSMDEIVAAMMFYNIALTARDLNNLTTISRADTDKGSIASSPAGLYRQKLMVENLRIPNIEKNMRINGFLNTLRNNVVDVKHDSKDDIRSALLNSSMPRLQAYYTLGIDSAMPMLKEYFPQYSDTMQGVVDAIDRNSNMIAIPETVIAAALKDLTNFYLSGTELFGNDKEHTFEEKRRYYIYSFPQRFVQMAATNEHLKDYKALRMLNVEDGSIVLKSNVKMRNDEKEQYQIDFERMLFDQDKEVRAFAVDLFKYCYYRYGLTISPLSYEGFFSTGFIKQIKGYTEALAEMPSVLSNDTSLIQGFLEQFYANRYDVQGVLPMLRWKKNTYFNGEFRFDKAFVTSNKTGEIFPRAIVTSKKGNRTLVFTGKFSTVDVEVNGNTVSKEYAVYKEVKNINHGATQQVLYNRSASLSDLLAYAEADEEAAKNSAMANSNPVDDYIMSPDSFEGGAEVENGSVEYEGDMEDLASVFESEVGASNLPQAPDIDTVTESTVDQNDTDGYDLTGIDDSIFTDPDPFGKPDDGDDNYIPDDTVGFC